MVAIATGGCFNPAPHPGAPCSTQSDCPASLVCTAGTCELPGTPGPDAPTADSPQPPDTCTDCPTVVTWLRFDGNLTDTNSEISAIAAGTSAVTFVDGHAGQAVHMPNDALGWVELGDSPAYDLDSGIVDLWFRYGADTPATDVGLISRDANGTTQDGHFNIRLGFDRNLVVRIQMQSDPSIEAFRCTADPIPVDTWTHVEAQFGPGGLELRVDGITATGTEWTNKAGTSTVSCTDPWTRGISGNDNPWAIGGLNWGSTEGTNEPVENIAGDVDLDDVIIWSVPQ